MTKKELEHIGSRKIDYYREKPQPKKTFDWDAFFGWIFIGAIVLVALGSCSG